MADAGARTGTGTPPAGSLPEDVRQRAKQQLASFCERGAGERRLEFTVEGVIATIHELRAVSPTWTFGDRPEAWSRRVALVQFRFDPGAQRWAAYWPDRQQCWQEYDVPPADDLATLLSAFGDDLDVFGS